MTRIRDKRNPRLGKIKIRQIPPGTWFYCRLRLWLKADHDVCVEAETGRRVPFNEEHYGYPVETEICVIQDIGPEQLFSDAKPSEIAYPPVGVTTVEHFQASAEWDDAIEMLRWACEQGATVLEMQAYRRAIRGEDLTWNP